MNRLEGFKYLIERYKFPLVKAKGKYPFEEGWPTLGFRSFEEIRFNRNHNAVIVTGRTSGLIGLDIDDAALFILTGYEVPDTFTVKSGGGNRFHHYFLLPEDGKDYKNRSFKSEGFDIKANGGGCVAPFSTHPDTGKRYKIVNDIEFAEAPEWLLKLSLEEKGKERKRKVKIERIAEIVEPNEQLIDTYKKLLFPAVPIGNRSEKLWLILHELTQDNLSDEEILGLFEYVPEGIGEKYFEKGGTRVGWLLNQIDKIRQEQDSLKVAPIKASNQLWVEYLCKDIINTFTNEYELTVSDAQRIAIEQVCNLLIALLDNENSDWYCIPLGVGSGKSQTIQHLIKFLYKYDTDRKYSIALSLEKISEIDDFNDWLIEHGVSTDYFQIVHHKVDNLKAVYESLKDTPVVIHTNYKLKGTSYLSDFFLYKGKQRDLLIFDESMLNSMTSAERSQDVASYLNQFLREYPMNQTLRDEVPKEIYEYFMELAATTTELERKLRNSSESNQEEIELQPNLLEEFSPPELIQFSNKIQNSINRGEGDISIFRDLLLLGKAPKELRQIFLQQEEGNTILFTMKEIMSSKIKNLVTTDASREIRTIFNFSEKPVKIYDVDNFKEYNGLKINTVEVNAGITGIKRYFPSKEITNPYLCYLEDIIKEAQGNHEKFLIFHSKQIEGFRDTVILHLIRKGIIQPQDEDRFQFETFGRENATNDYRECSCIIFLGLHYKPKHALKALILGETKSMDGILPWMVDKVETGELTMQIQQGSGRGTIRDGGKQVVYLHDYNPSRFTNGLQKVFPGAEINQVTLPTLEKWKQVEGADELERRRKEDRLKGFRRTYKDWGLPVDKALEEEFQLQDLTPAKFLKAKGYKKVA